ncbi:MAG TPA: peptidylprolyl isomerase [Microcella sp.]|nr:peptidylprolyl isomerase [Microcella sp.]
MAQASSKDREARERLRRYQARQTVHDGALRRRRRDNIASLIAVVAAAAIASGALLAYESGPGAPEPEPSASASPTPEPTAEAPDPALSENRTWTGALTLNEEVELGIELDGAAAPQAVAAVTTLINEGFYDGLSCHRLTSGNIFVLQCGDPAGNGTGGPDFRFGPIENAPADSLYPAGTIAMARAGGDAFSMGSQFFIVYGDSAIPTDSAGGYTVIGEVTSGLDELTNTIVAGGIEGGASDGAPRIPTTITSITIE